MWKKVFVSLLVKRLVSSPRHQWSSLLVSPISWNNIPCHQGRNPWIVNIYIYQTNSYHILRDPHHCFQKYKLFINSPFEYSWYVILVLLRQKTKQSWMIDDCSWCPSYLATSLHCKRFVHIGCLAPSVLICTTVLQAISGMGDPDVQIIPFLQIIAMSTKSHMELQVCLKTKQLQDHFYDCLLHQNCIANLFFLQFSW